MITIEIPRFTACRWMVSDMSGDLRAFPTKREAESWIKGDSSYVIRQIPKVIKTITVEEAPF